MRVIKEGVHALAALFGAIGYCAEQVARLFGSQTVVRGPAPPPPNVQSTTAKLGDDFLLVTSVGFNDHLASNIDAIDAALIGVLGATGVFAVLAVDKLRELAVWPRWIAISLFAASALSSFVGYAYGFINDQPRDVPRPALFVADFARNGSKALARALSAVVHASEQNMRIRTRKRVIALIAIGLLIAGAVVVTYARLTGDVHTPLSPQPMSWYNNGHGRPG